MLPVKFAGSVPQYERLRVVLKMRNQTELSCGVSRPLEPSENHVAPYAGIRARRVPARVGTFRSP